MKRNKWISLFVIVWIVVFHYETLRLNYLSPLVLRLRSARALSEAEGRVEGFVGRQLPKLKFLYPPAGWIMFFNVDRSYGFAEVYGVSKGQPSLIDPHQIFETRFVWYDNIHRNVLISVLSAHDAPRFCRYLHRKFPQHEAFAVVYAQYPDVATQPNEVFRQIAYRCQERFVHSPRSTVHRFQAASFRLQAAACGL